MFVTVPGVELVTSTVTWQLASAAILPPLRLRLPPPATAVTVPPHVFVVPGGVSFTTPPGYVSVNATPVNPIPVFGFTIVIVIVEVPPDGIVSGLNIFVTVGARIVTVRSSLAGAALFPKSVCKSPAAIVFVCVPTVEEVTSTSIVHPPEGIVDPFA